MKKNIVLVIVTILLVAATCVFALNYTKESPTKSEYLRIHVRANSNTTIDQNIKYMVKDELVTFITPYVAECSTKDEAMDMVNGLLKSIESVCDGVLKENGFTYTSRASIRQEEFPTRTYGDFTLESGVYDALIVELGTGEGDNWWCVIYPPLCFTAGNGNVTYISAIQQIIKKWKNSLSA
jgi:stage II sporulation protein R